MVHTMSGVVQSRASDLTDSSAKVVECHPIFFVYLQHLRHSLNAVATKSVATLTYILFGHGKFEEESSSLIGRFGAPNVLRSGLLALLCCLWRLPLLCTTSRFFEALEDKRNPHSANRRYGRHKSALETNARDR